jgi:FMN phosphatase YigB (HAD superfamily)
MIEAVLFDIGDTLFHVPTAKFRPYLETLTQSLYEQLKQKGFFAAALCAVPARPSPAFYLGFFVVPVDPP